MKIEFHKKFSKNFKKRIQPHTSLTKKFEQRFDLFVKNPNHPLLKNHELIGKKIGLRAFSITGDIRVIYRIKNKTIQLFDIGTHNQVY